MYTSVRANKCVCACERACVCVNPWSESEGGCTSIQRLAKSISMLG